MKTRIRLIALLLALALLLQMGVFATEPADDSPADTTTDTTEPTDPNEGETPVDPGNGGDTTEPEDPDAGGDTTDPENPDAGDGTTDPEDPDAGDGTTDPEDPEDPEEPEPPAPIALQASMADGQVFAARQQSLRVQLVQGETVLDPAGIQATLNDKALSGTVDGDAMVYELTLKLGDNRIDLRAGEGEEALSLSLTVRFDIEIPNDWSHDALVFCVDNGILQGNQHSDLCPTDNATRAQLAAMLVRLFGATEQADLSGYTDVPANAWYYGELASAVAMGIFEGSGGKLTPNNKITREQAFTVIARAFGVAGGSSATLNQFSDRADVSSWAESSVAAMVEAGYVNGNTSGTLKPKGNITRRELAQVLYNILDRITDDPEQLGSGANLYTGPLEALNGKTIDGDLFLSYGCGSGQLTLTGLQVNGRLVIRLGSGTTLNLEGCSYSSISICSGTRVVCDAPSPIALLMADGAQLTGGADQAIVTADGILYNGRYENVYVYGGDVVLAATSTAGVIYVTGEAAGSTITVYGTAATVDAQATDLTFDGTGRINALYEYYLDTVVQCNVGDRVDRIDAGLDGVVVTQSTVPTAYTNANTVTVSGTISGVNTTQAYGVPNGVRTCTVTYSYNGKTIKTDNNFQLKDGATVSCEVTIPHYEGMAAQQTVTVTIRYGADRYTKKLVCNTPNYSTHYNEARNVKTIHVEAWTRYSCSAYAYANLTGYRTTIPAGTLVYFIDNNGSSNLIETVNGSRYYIAAGSIGISGKAYYSTSVAYSTGVKEAFVNEVHNYDSSSQYLVWINLYTQTTNVFQGSQGNWDLIRSCKCATGKNSTPTRPGVFSILYKSYRWTFDDDYYEVFYPCIFDGGIATHTRTYYYGTRNLLDSRLGMTITHGCVRMPDADAIWIYRNCPVGTTVVVW